MADNPIFSNLKVLELASVAPAVGQFFAELGATVIKVENPLTNGDVTRNWKLPVEMDSNEVSAYFSSVNWGKKSIAVDINQEEGKQLIYKLVETTDVVIASYKRPMTPGNLAWIMTTFLPSIPKLFTAMSPAMAMIIRKQVMMLLFRRRQDLYI